MFRVKICGITTVAEAEAVVDAGADAIGLNFYPKSPRCIDPATAEEIVSAVGGRLGIVGVFVNASTGQMARLADQLPLDYIQLHGDEPTGQLSELAPRRAIRALRLRRDHEDSIAEFLTAARTSGAPPAAILVDAYQQGSFGGTGTIVNWGQVKDLKARLGDCALILAGGLHPTNIRDAIHQTACDGVDVASGVELRPGVKDIGKMRQFVITAMEALGEVEEKSSKQPD
ncbi:MAG: phosphoribosylanthranilate isomerase [Planctomycetota bacterium]